MTAPPLPPTFQIEIFKALPEPGLSGACDVSDVAVNDTDGCVGYVAPVMNGSSGTVNLQLGDDSDDTISLLPVVEDSNASS